MTGLLTSAAVAQLLGVRPDDVRRWMRTGQCPVVVVGRRRRVPGEWVAGEVAAGRAG